MLIGIPNMGGPIVDMIIVDSHMSRGKGTI